MYLKTTLFASILLMLSSAAFAQDKIFKRDGSVIEAKVLEVGVKTVSYKRIDNEDGPRYTIAKSALERIEFENGTNEFFDERSRVRHSPKVDNSKYGNNILAFFPMLVNNGGVGLGLSYERLLGKESIISFYMPVSATIRSEYGNYYNNGNTIVQGNPDSYSYFVMPGIKIYPTGAKGKVRYGIGPAVALNYGNNADNLQPLYGANGTITYNYSRRDYFSAGAVINNSLNISPTKRLYLGLELALGFIFYEDYGGSSYTYSFEPYDLDEPIAQFGFKIGYRF
ncbi:MAG: hypothetical protein R2800_06095 [Flavipsychrobacter sp.]